MHTGTLKFIRDGERRNIQVRAVLLDSGYALKSKRENEEAAMI